MTISLSAQKIVKRFGGVTALADGGLAIRGGEVLALMGANGSGKSTLSKIINGVLSADEGEMTLDGTPVRFRTPHEARARGIAAVYQELSLVPEMTVAENIWLGHEPLQLGRVNQRALARQTQALIDLFAGAVSAALQPDTRAAQLPPDERQIVEILKALSLEPRLIILDEATASLDSRQVARLFELVARWKSEDRAVVFVSHRMEEVFRLADRVTVLRNGRTVGSSAIGETNEAALVAQMIEGGTTPRHNLAADLSARQLRLRAEDLSSGRLAGVDFAVRDGELLGLGGLRGQGQSELLLAIFGALPFTGKLTLREQSAHFNNPRQAMHAGVAYVPGDRGSQGLLSIRSILDNLQLPSWGAYGTPLHMAKARRAANDVGSELRLKMASLDAPVSSLSGGNAQKVVLGKWLLRKPSLLLLDDPTKGVDVGAKGDFYTILNTLRAEGTAIILYSSDDDELLGLSDRILVLHDGTIAAELAGSTLNKSELVRASLGTAHASN